MKKSILFMSILILALAIVSCAIEPAWTGFNKEDLLKNVEMIELIYYHNDNYELVDPDKHLLIFNPQKCERIQILDDFQKEDFIGEFCQFQFNSEGKSVNEPTGYCLILHLNNDHFYVVSCAYYGGKTAYRMTAEFDSNYNFVKNVGPLDGQPAFEILLDKYFDKYVIEN